MVQNINCTLDTYKKIMLLSVHCKCEFKSCKGGSWKNWLWKWVPVGYSMRYKRVTISMCKRLVQGKRCAGIRSSWSKEKSFHLAYSTHLCIAHWDFALEPSYIWPVAPSIKNLWPTWKHSWTTPANIHCNHGNRLAYSIKIKEDKSH